MGSVKVELIILAQFIGYLGPGKQVVNRAGGSDHSERENRICKLNEHGEEEMAPLDSLCGLLYV